MSLITIVLFFIYTWGLGYTATNFLSKPKFFLERQLLNIGIGLTIFPFLATLLNLLHIPLDYKIFLILALAFPIYKLAKERKIPTPVLKLRKSDITIIFVIIIAIISLFIYTKGAFSYPYLEDEDPWGHSVGVKYVALEKNAYDPVLVNTHREIDPVLSYIDPYPPAYDILLVILHQTSEDLTWTMKYFNALIIRLGFIFFYLFAKYFTMSRNKALFATFILASLTSYLSHFIWAHALIITIFFPTLYAFDRIKEDKRWAYLAAIATASIWLTQNISQPIKLTTMLLIFIVVASITYNKLLKRHLLALGAGMAASFIWWGVILNKYGIQGFLSYYGGASAARAATSTITPSLLTRIVGIINKLVAPGGTGSRAYTFTDFFIAKSQNMINNPIGVGMIISILTLIGVTYILIKYRTKIVSQENTWIAISLFWLIFTFWAVNGTTFPISVAKGSFRSWMIMAIPIALIATEGAYYLIRKANKIKLPKAVILILIIIGVLLTSTQQKYDVNTVVWPSSGTWTIPQEPSEYARWFNTIPADSKVFLYSPRDKITIGFGKYSCMWCQDVINFRNNILDKDATELHSLIKQR